MHSNKPVELKSAPLECRVGQRIARYVLCPGFVRSRHDGQEHYIGSMALARLYGVRIEQCEIYEPAQWWPESYYRMAEERTRGLIKLAPRPDGNYTVPNAELRGATDELK